MPNWVHNAIICKPELATKILNEKGEVDFGVLVPEPSTKEELLTVYGEKYLDALDENGHSINSLMHSDGKGWFNWYNWSIDFWGTKWNACDSYSYKDRSNDYMLITFDTAWSKPEKWIEALEKLGEPFILCWTEEQGFGACEGYNGNLNVDREWGYYEYNEDENEPCDGIDREPPTVEDIVKFLGLDD